MSKRTPRRAYQNPRANRSGGKWIWLLVGGFMFALVAIAMAVAGYLFWKNSGGPPTDQIASANVPGAMSYTELRKLTSDFNSKNTSTSDPIKIPVTYDDAVDQLASASVGSTSKKHVDSQKLVTSEWLYDRELSDAQIPRIAKSLAESFHESTTEGLKKSLARTFTRWGHKDHVHLFLGEDPEEYMVPLMLDVIEKFPSKSSTETVVGFLDSKYGDAAERVLMNMDPANAKLLVPVYDSEDTSASDRAKSVFEHWEVDIDKARLEYYVPEAVGGNQKAWEVVANIPFNKSLQPIVIDGLRRFDRSELSLDDWLDACLSWGDENLIPLIHEVYGGNFSFNRDKALKFITKHPHSSSVPTLVDRLLNSWSSESEQISAALLSLYESDIDVDFENDVHRAIVLRYNDFGMFQKPALKNLFDTTDFDPNILVDQCLEDIRISNKSNNAFETLGKIEVIESRRFEVAEAVEGVIKAGGIPGFHTDETFLHWATPENDYVYELLDDQFRSEKWRSALKIALDGKDNQNKFIVPVARALGDFFKGEEIIDVLTQHGPKSQGLMMTMLQSDNPKELIGACRVLQIIGNEECIPTLKTLSKTAKRVKNKAVYDAVILAGTAITNRIGPDVVKAYEKKLKDEAKEKK